MPETTSHEASKSIASPDSKIDLFTARDSDKVLEAVTGLALTANNLPVGDSRQVSLLTNPALDQRFQLSQANLSRLIHAVSPPSTHPLTPKEEQEMVRIYTRTVEHSLEKSNGALDLASGFRDTPLTDAESKAAATATMFQKSKKPFLGPRLAESYKPQYQFRSQPLDNSTAPFVPPFVKFDFTPVPPPSPQPFEDGGDDSESEHSSEVVKEDDSGLKKADESEPKKEGDSKRKKRYGKAKKREKAVSLHPFKKEILESVAANIAKEPFNAENVMVYKPFHETPFTFVDTEKELLAVAERFSKCTEIAIDLEHHDRRSFLGFTCLIQMSTRHEDVVFDVINLWSEKVHSALADIFADPDITKVLHGADNDIEWLERDFGLYIVNMFDTGQAARVLQYPNASLAYLLNLYCQVKADGKKSFQRADWRIRPIPESMMNYARSDTHYLLYIYDRLRMELYAKKGDEVRQVYEKSGGVSLHRFRKPLFVAGRALKVAVKKHLRFDKYQVAILESLFVWRDAASRTEDESPQYLARDAWLIAVARAKSSARTPEGLLRVLGFAAINARFIRKHHVDVARRIADTLDSEVAPLPEKKKPRKKTAESASTDSTASSPESSSSFSQANGGARKKYNKKNRKNTATSPQDSTQVSPKKKLNPAAPVFTPSKSKASKSKPSVRVCGKKASLLFESDSASGSERSNGSQRRETSPVVEGQTSIANECNFPSFGGAKKGGTVPGKKDVKTKTCTRGGSKSEQSERSSPAKAAAVTSAKKSVFDLSESDEDDTTHAGALKDESEEEASKSERSTVSKVKAGMPKADIGFSELCMNGKEEADETEKKAEAETNGMNGMEEAEEEIVALSSTRKPRKKKTAEREKKATAATGEAVKPYDFLAEIEKDKKKKKAEGEKGTKGTKSEVFRAMKEGKPNKTRRSKKNPASGSRSMTFSAAK